MRLTINSGVNPISPDYRERIFRLRHSISVGWLLSRTLNDAVWEVRHEAAGWFSHRLRMWRCDGGRCAKCADDIGVFAAYGRGLCA
jgi:hypothetical protein